jgi:hypothetical protein
VPAGIDLVCVQALSPKQHRFPSTAAFAEALEDAARHDGVRIAAAREVGRFVRELAPAPGPGAQAQVPLPEFNIPLTPPRQAPALGVDTPQRWQMTPPAIPGVEGRTPPALPGVLPAGGSDPMAAFSAQIPGTTLNTADVVHAGPRPPLPGGLALDTNPNTNASMVATPATLGGGQKKKAVITVLAAMGLATIGGAVAWLVVGPNSAGGPAGPPSASGAEIPTPAATPGETETPTPEPTGSASADGSAAPTTSALVVTGGKTPGRRYRPDGKTPVEPRPTASPTTSPTPTQTEFRPNRP